MRFLTFLFSAFLLFFSLLLAGEYSFAASKAYLSIDEKIELKVNNISSRAEVEWVISQDGAIIETKKGKTLQYSFPKIGEYVVRTSVTDVDGNVDVSVVEVVVSQSLPNFAPLEAVISSVPAPKDGVITLSGESADVTFSFRDSKGEVEKYELEADVFSDSDGDGIIDNDVDNKDDPSYLSGTFYTHTYVNTGIPSKAVLRVIGDGGEVQESSVTLLFDESGEDKTQKQLRAVLNTVPESDSAGNIPFPKSGGTLLVFAGESEGDITEYHIDVDQDKNPDNTGTDSFLEGSVYPIEINSLLEEQIITLTVKSKSGQVHAIQKTLVPANTVYISPSGNSYLSPLLFASRSKILEGQTVSFKVFNAPENSRFSWDFDGDGVFEIEDSEVSEVEYKYAQEGNYSTRVEIVESGKSTLIQRRTVSVFNKNEGQIKTLPPEAMFLAQLDSNKVSFLSSESKADSNLINTDLSFSWDFGDGYKTEGPNPIHTYKEGGDYTVVLSVEDSVGRTAVYSEEISITDLNHDFDESQHGGISIPEESPLEPTPEVIAATTLPEVTDVPDESNENRENDTEGSTASREGFSFPWWVLPPLLIFLLPALFLLKKKIDEPDKSFSDIIHGIIHPPKRDLDEKGKESVEAEIVGSDILSPEVPQDAGNNDKDGEDDVPDWMRSYDDDELEQGSEQLEENESLSPVDNPLVDSSLEVIAPELPESLPSEDDTKISKDIVDPAPLEENDGVVPDWMTPSVSEESEGSEVIDSVPLAEDKEKEEGGDLLEEVSPFDVDHPEWLQDIKGDDEIAEENGVALSPSGDVLPNDENLEAVENSENERSQDTPLDSLDSSNDLDWLEAESKEGDEIDVNDIGVEHDEGIVKDNEEHSIFDSKESFTHDSGELMEAELPGNAVSSDEADGDISDLPLSETSDEPIPDWLQEEGGVSDGILEDVEPSYEGVSEEGSSESVLNDQVQKKTNDEVFNSESLQDDEKTNVLESGDEGDKNIGEIEITAVDAKIDEKSDNSDIPEWLR